MRHAGSLFVLVFFLAACEHAGPLEPGGLEPTLESIQANIFDTNCALSGCHIGGGDTLPSALDLSDGQARASLVGVTSIEVPDLLRVDPGNPDDSYLIWKLEGRPGIVGLRMPRQQPALSDEQIGVVREWIEMGAN